MKLVCDRGQQQLFSFFLNYTLILIFFAFISLLLNVIFDKNVMFDNPKKTTNFYVSFMFVCVNHGTMHDDVMQILLLYRN